MLSSALQRPAASVKKGLQLAMPWLLQAKPAGICRRRAIFTISYTSTSKPSPPSTLISPSIQTPRPVLVFNDLSHHYQSQYKAPTIGFEDSRSRTYQIVLPSLSCQPPFSPPFPAPSSRSLPGGANMNVQVRFTPARSTQTAFYAEGTAGSPSATLVLLSSSVVCSPIEPSIEILNESRPRSIRSNTETTTKLN